MAILNSWKLWRDNFDFAEPSSAGFTDCTHAVKSGCHCKCWKVLRIGYTSSDHNRAHHKLYEGSYHLQVKQDYDQGKLKLENVVTNKFATTYLSADSDLHTSENKSSLPASDAVTAENGCVAPEVSELDPERIASEAKEDEEASNHAQLADNLGHCPSIAEPCKIPTGDEQSELIKTTDSNAEGSQPLVPLVTETAQEKRSLPSDLSPFRVVVNCTPPGENSAASGLSDTGPSPLTMLLRDSALTGLDPKLLFPDAELPMTDGPWSGLLASDELDDDDELEQSFLDAVTQDSERDEPFSGMFGTGQDWLGLQRRHEELQQELAVLQSHSYASQMLMSNSEPPGLPGNSASGPTEHCNGESGEDAADQTGWDLQCLPHVIW